MKNAIRMVKSCLSDILLILGANSQKNTPLLQSQSILLKCRICLRRRRFVTNLDILHTIITDDAAPEGIVEI